MPYDRLPDDQTGTEDQAYAYLNRQFQSPTLTPLGGMPRPINDFEKVEIISFAKQDPPFDPPYTPGMTITGHMVNLVGEQMPPYVEAQLREKPFSGAPVCLTCPRIYSYDHTLPGEVPPLRADLWGREVPGAPYVPRGSSINPQKVLTYLLYAYPSAFWPTIFRAHTSVDYNRFYVSWPDARDAGGYSIQQFVDQCGEVSAALSCGAFLSAKGRYAGNDIDGDPQDMSVQQYQDRVGPVLTALLEAKVIREAVAAWEVGLYMVPGATTQNICKWVGQLAHAHGVEASVHFPTEYWAWQEPGLEGDPFWEAIGGDLDRLKYQSSPTADIGWVQSKLVDVLNHMAKFGVIVDACELRAAQQFDGSLSERDASIFSYLVACTRARMAVGGVCNGWALP